MALVKSPIDVIPFCALMFQDPAVYPEVLERLKKTFGSLVDSCGPFAVRENTHYYDREMGKELQKMYFVFDRPFNRDQLADIKHETNNLEQEYCDTSGNRRINCDPGYISVDKFVLASAKDYFHRISIGKGIYAEVTLHFTQKGIRWFSWTYNDYQEPAVQELLLHGRKLAEAL